MVEKRPERFDDWRGRRGGGASESAGLAMEVENAFVRGPWRSLVLQAVHTELARRRPIAFFGIAEERCN
jgi:hypothetical protein